MEWAAEWISDPIIAQYGEKGPGSNPGPFYYCHNLISLFIMGDSFENFLAWRLSDRHHASELWEFEYSLSRYLLNLSSSELARRYLGLCKNISFLVCEQRDEVPIQAQCHSTWWWLRKRHQMLAEFKQRNCEPPRCVLEQTTSPTRRAPYLLTRPYDSKSLVRYGEAKWLLPLAASGKIRFTPASSYKNEQLSQARYDDELNQSTFSRGDRVTISTMDGKRIPIIGDLKTTINTKADMYVFCSSNEFDPKLIDEFSKNDNLPADAYCVLWDVDEFYRRVVAGTHRNFPGWTFHHLPISYFDPYENGKNYISPGVSKKFDFAYQREYRFIWLPQRPGLLSDPIDFELGPLNDILTVFSCDGSIIAGCTDRVAA